MDLSRGNEKAIGVFVFGKQLGWIPKETISEVERMDQVELKISLITFKEKEISFHFSKIDYMSQKFPFLSCNSSASPFLYTSSLKNINTDYFFFWS